jgi:RNA polymerase sigma-70 factor (ECF subfamily)
VANRADAEDIAQQALLVACAKFKTLRGENLKGWLWTIARRLIVDFYRTQRRFEFVDTEDATHLAAEPALQTDPEAVPESCANRDRLRCYLDCIAKMLPLEAQVAVLLADVHGNLDKDSATAMRISLPSFKLLLHQGRARLHEVAGGRCALADHGERAREEQSLCVITRESGGGNGEDGARAGGGHPKFVTKTGEISRLKQPDHISDRNAARTCAGPRNQSNHGMWANGEIRTPAREGNGQPNSAEKACSLGCKGCRVTQCRFGVDCRLGFKCCRIVPKLLGLRDRLLETLAQAVGAL